MPDIDRILTGKIAHMLRSCAPTKKTETYYCFLCPAGWPDPPKEETKDNED